MCSYRHQYDIMMLDKKATIKCKVNYAFYFWTFKEPVTS